MNLDEIEKSGGFVAARPVAKEISFDGFDETGKRKKYTATVGVRTLSYADFQARRKEYAEFEIQRNAEIEAFRQAKADEEVDTDELEPSPPSWEMALVSAAARFGETHKEVLSLARAHDLQHSLASALFRAVMEENAADKKKVNTDGRVLARNGDKQHRGKNHPRSKAEPDHGGNPGLDGVLPATRNLESQPQT